jgi:hypothetical protein
LREFIGRIRLRLRGKNKVLGWKMTPEQALAFFSSQRKTVLTFLGYSTGYENKDHMLQVVRVILSGHSPETTLINIGATKGGIGAAYPLAKSLGFVTTGIVSTKALAGGTEISEAVDYICFIADEQWGGKLPGSDELSPTSKAMVDCSDVMFGVGGGEISRDEMVAAQEKGKPAYFYPAEVSHAEAIQRAEKMGLPHPDSFWGEAHAVFGRQQG